MKENSDFTSFLVNKQTVSIGTYNRYQILITSQILLNKLILKT